MARCSSEKDSVLIIDDDVAFLKMVGETLKKDWDVSFAASGAEALALLRSGYLPDIILLDVDMPILDGFETFKELRALSSPLPGVPILFLTGVSEPEYEYRGLSMGAQDYVTKPVSPAVLKHRLAMHLETSRRLSEALFLDEARLQSLVQPLTETELKIARMLAKNYTNDEIATHCNYSLSHVKRMVSQILSKLGIERRYQIKEFLK